MSLTYHSPEVFRIAGLDLKFHYRSYLPSLNPYWNLFRKDFQKADGPEIPIFFENDTGGYPNVETYSLDSGCVLVRTNDDIMVVGRDWSYARIFKPINRLSMETLLLELFYTHALRRRMLQIHCSIVDDHGRGILFLGPSGIGKTTQAEKWAEYRSASIINGDIGFVQLTPDGPSAWGTPWHGSSPYCLNAQVPVRALVVLKQASMNGLRPLTGFERVAEVSGSVFYPSWLEGGVEVAAGLLHELLTTVPVYRLDNRADREAVELLAAKLDRNVSS